jgi:hypothetical protein
VFALLPGMSKVMIAKESTKSRVRALMTGLGEG